MVRPPGYEFKRQQHLCDVSYRLHSYDKFAQYTHTPKTGFPLFRVILHIVYAPDYRIVANGLKLKLLGGIHGGPVELCPREAWNSYDCLRTYVGAVQKVIGILARDLTSRPPTSQSKEVSEIIVAS